MKGILTVTVLLLFCSLAFGQGFSVGANLGGSYNSMNPDDPTMDNLTGLGFGGGLVFEVDFLPMLGVELDILYSQYKYSYSGELMLIGDYDITMTYNNLVVPILLKYKFAMPTISPYFVAGPSIIKNLSGETEITLMDTTVTADFEDDELELDFGIQFGAGANIGVTPVINISPYVRFQYNLTGDLDWTDGFKESMYDILFGINFTYKIR